jgi:hemoglobin
MITNEELNMTNYGEGSATYEALGGLAGLTRLVTDFYTIMDQSPDYQLIRQMHPGDLEESIDKLVCFLSGWTGGEQLYAKKYKAVGIPRAHQHLSIDEAERDMWLACMQEALLKQDYPESLVDYMLAQLAIPAERVRVVSVANRNQ